MDQLIGFFMTNAYAQAQTATPQSGSFSFVIMFVVLFIFIYFFVWRPQNKRAKEQQMLMNSIAKGDEVMTAGGLLGRVTKITDQYIALNVSNNVEIMMQKSSIVTVLPKGTIKSIE